MSSPAREPSGLPRSSLDRVFRALEEQGRQPRQRGTHIQARCPLHEDSSPSLSIDWKAASGMTLLACHSGSCPAADEKDILEALGSAVDRPVRRAVTGSTGTVRSGAAVIAAAAQRCAGGEPARTAAQAVAARPGTGDHRMGRGPQLRLGR